MVYSVGVLLLRSAVHRHGFFCGGAAFRDPSDAAFLAAERNSMIRNLLLDLDDTILDFHRAEKISEEDEKAKITLQKEE